MKVRVKYAKTGPLKFISHLDVMRYFQKSIRRAGLDIAYSTGLSPHEIISFAAPMPLMLTSEAEYFDAEFNSLPSHEEFVQRLNAAGTPFMQVFDAAILPEKALNSMAAVTASSYLVTLTEKGEKELGELWRERFSEIIDTLVREDAIVVIKKTKKKEEPTDIRPMIHQLEYRTGEDGSGSIYMLLAAGSKVNLRPEQILTEIEARLFVPYDRFHFDILRLETYMDGAGEEGPRFVPLIEAGNRDF
jgi:radical SAM-linked protein